MKKYQYLASWDDQTLTRVGEPVVVLGDSNVSQVEVILPSDFLLDPTEAVARMYFLLPGEKESGFETLETATKDENGDSHVTWTIKHVHSQKGGRLAFSLTLIGDDAQWDSRTAIIPVYESRYQPESEEAEEPYTGRLTALEGSMASIRGEFAEVQEDFEELKETATLGTPIPESLVANMTEGHVYIYTGTEPGYTAGHVYYYVGGALTDGGVYGGTAVDTTLTEPGKAADAAAVGAEVSTIKEDLSAIQGLTSDIKTALLNCFENVAWKGNDPSGQSYINALSAALNPPANLASISAVYTQSGIVYDTATLESLRNNLVVTAHYSDSTTATITDYILSGSLVVGSNIITVSYGGKTATFTVVVTSSALFSLRNQEFTSESEAIDTGVNLFSADSDWTIACDLSVPVAIGRNFRILSCLQSASPYNGFMYGYESNIMKIKWVSRTAIAAPTTFGPSFTGNHKCVFTHAAGGGLNCYFRDNDGEVSTLSPTTSWAAIETQNLKVGGAGTTLNFVGTINCIDVYGRVFDANEINAFMGVE